MKRILPALLLAITITAHAADLPKERLYSFGIPGASMVCQFTPETIDGTIESGTAVFWQLGTSNYWALRYVDTGLLVHMTGLPGYFFHLGDNGLEYVPPGGFNMTLQ